jgi:carbon monoxide dehydrogenase subunit G
MEIDKSLYIAATPEQIWAVLLDPQAMASCVPGMQSVEIINPDEYAALMHVKIAFVSARFKLRTRIVERREPLFLKAEGTGEDSSVASSLKQVTELTLTPQGNGSTELRIKVQVDLLGRMGSFGLSVMKTKADRLWDEFGVNLAKRLAGETVPVSQVAVAEQTQSERDACPAGSAHGSPAPSVQPTSNNDGGYGWWERLLRTLGIQPLIPGLAKGVIVVEVLRPDQTRIRIEWPADQTDACAHWLRETMR